MATSLTMDNLLAKFEIENLPCLTKSQQLGAGAFGAVYKVFVEGIPRIAKRLHDILLVQENCPEGKKAIRKRFEDECLLLSTLNHPNIVEFIGVHYSDQARTDLCLIMECLYMNLEQYLDPKTCPDIPVSIKVSILCDVSAGLLYLHYHNPPIIHRDLSAGNILLTRDLQAKIADLGVSKLLDVHPNKLAKQTKCPGALAYMPPEALKENPDYNTQLDVFSFGETALYLAIQEFPVVFDASSDQEMPAALQRKEVHLLNRKKWISMLPENHCLCEVINSCLQDLPERRPTTEELNSLMRKLCVKHPKSLSDVISAWCDRAEQDQHKKCPIQLTEVQPDLVTDSVQESNSLLESKLVTVKHEASQLWHEIETLKNENHHLKDAMARMGDFTTANSETQLELNKLQLKYEKLYSEKRTVQNQLEIAKAEADVLKVRYEDEKNAHSKTHSKLNEEIRDHKEKAKHYLDEAARLKVELDQALNDYQSMRHQFRQQRREYDKLHKQLRETDAKMVAHSGEIEKLWKKLKKADADLVKANSQLKKASNGTSVVPQPETERV